MKSIALLDKVAKVSVYLVAFLLPLWFLPFTQNILLYQKQVVLVVLVFLGLVAWLAKTVNQGEVRLRISWLHVPVLLVVLAAGISTLLSLWRYGSFWGFPLDLSDNFLTIIAFSLLYFLVVHVIEDTRHLFRLLATMLVSFTVASLYTVLQTYQVYLLPFAFAKVPTFNTLGNINSVAVLSAVLLPLALALAFVSKLVLRWLLWGVAAMLFATLVLINFQSAWIALTAGLLVLLAFGMWNIRKRQEFGWVSFPMALIIVAVFFMVFQVSLPGSPRTIPGEVSPSQGSTFNIAKQVLAERPLFGSGPGTFVFEYAKYRPVELNQTVFFGTRFVSGSSEILDWLITKGIVGLILLLALMGVTKVFGAKMLMRLQGDNFSWMVGLGLFASFVAVVVSQLVYPSGFLLWFVFWMLLGGLGFLIARYPRVYSVATHPFLALGSSFVFLLILIFGLGLLFIGGQKYIAEAQYLKGARASSQGDLDGAITSVLKAATLNPAVDLYWRDLSQLYLARVNQIAADESLSQEQRAQQTQVAVSNAVAAARTAGTTAPVNVANWNVQGFVYRSLIGIQGAENLAVEGYTKASELEPTSPFPWTELARVYVLQAQSLSQQENTEQQREEVLQKALDSLEKSLELKDDYAPAHYLTAVVYEQQGNSKEAIAKLEETKRIAPNDIGLAFQLGTIYWQQRDLNEAQAELERAKEIDPNYSNARYILGLVYDAQGETEKAKEEFTVVEQRNPNNEEIKKILANLEQGLPALEGVTPQEPPIQQAPPEIQE